jgi:hypothetical protein
VTKTLHNHVTNLMLRLVEWEGNYTTPIPLLKKLVPPAQGLTGSYISTIVTNRKRNERTNVLNFSSLALRAAVRCNCPLGGALLIYYCISILNGVSLANDTEEQAIGTWLQYPSQC